MITYVWHVYDAHIWSHMFDKYMMHTYDHICLTHIWFTYMIHTYDLTLLDLHTYDLEFLWSYMCQTYDHMLDTYMIWSKWIIYVSRIWSYTCADIWCTYMILLSNHMSFPLVMGLTWPSTQYSGVRLINEWRDYKFNYIPWTSIFCFFIKYFYNILFDFELVYFVLPTTQSTL